MSWVRPKHCSKTGCLPGRPGRLRERLSLQAHLAWCELKLRLRTRPDQHRRRQLLDILHHYWRAGRFPENSFVAGGRLPIFIDDAGSHCAVGQLMAESGAAELAWDINRRRRFVYLDQLDLDREPEIKNWLARHQLRPSEAAQIQPTYGFIGSDPTHVHGGLSGGDWLIAIASIIFSLGLLLPTAALIFLVRRPFADKFALFLQRLGGLVLTAVGAGSLLALATYISSQTSPPRIPVVINLVANLVFLSLVGVWLQRLKSGRPMLGFDPERNRYRPLMRLLFYVFGVVFLVGIVAGNGLQAGPGAGPGWLIYFNLLSLLVLPLLLAHRPLHDRQPRLKRSIFGGFLTSVLVLVFILPSPIYTFEQLATRSSGEWVSCQAGANYTRRPASCWEITGGLPKLIQPTTWEPVPEPEVYPDNPGLY